MQRWFGRGFGFGGSSTPWPYVGLGWGGLPRCWHDLGAPFVSYSVSREEEKTALKSQAQMLRRWLAEIEKGVKDLEAENERNKGYEEGPAYGP